MAYSLMDRIMAEDTLEKDVSFERIPIHTFMAALVAYQSSWVTGNQITNGLNLTPAQASDMQHFYNTITSNGITNEQVHAALLLGSQGLATRSNIKTWLMVSSVT